MRSLLPMGWIVAGCALAASLVVGADNKSPLEHIKAVGKLGEGNPAAQQAWKDLVGQGPAKIPEILLAFDDDPIQCNWLRLAAETIADKTEAAGKPLPLKELEELVKDTKNPPAGRRVGYELLLRGDPSAADRLLPNMIQDPSNELRRDAVARVLGQAEKELESGEKEKAKANFRLALSGACDEDQVDTIAKALEKLGDKVDLAKHFGFVRAWHLVGPFSNAEAAHFNTVNPPEEKIDLKATYPSKEDPKAQIRWQTYTTEDPYGLVDLNRLYSPWKGVTAYALALVDSPKEQRIQIRLGSINAFKVFINGKEVLAHEEYHHGMRVDQYSGPGLLREGRNELLVKICQNEKKMPWEKEWRFQVRLTDAVGAAVPFTQAAVPSQLTLKPEQTKKK